MENKCIFKKLIFLVTLLICVTLFGCNTVINNNDKQTNNEFTLEYSVIGNGYIESDIPSGSKFSSTKLITLRAITIDSSNFLGWYINDEEYTKDDVIAIVIKENTVIVAKFDGENILDKINNNIQGLKENELAIIKVNVLAQCHIGILVGDETGVMLIYFGYSSDYQIATEIGDVYIIEGIPYLYNDRMQFNSSAKMTKIGNKNINNETSALNIKEYQENPEYGKFVQVNGTLEYDGYYRIKMDNDYINLYYPSVQFPLNNYIDSTVTIKGYLLVLNNNVPLIIVTFLSGSISYSNTIKAYFDDNWKNPIAEVNGYSYQMVKNGDHYELENQNNIHTICFRSNNLHTVSFNYDSDFPCFVLGEMQYDNCYSGYFTKEQNINNDVVKVTTLEMNDLHGYIDDGRANMANTSYLINQIRNENDKDDIVLIANGDMFQGTALSNITRGRTIVEAMNLMQFDAMGIGNHEFDWGIEEIFKYFDGDVNNGEANFPLINSNIAYKNNELVLSNNIVSSTMINKNGIKIGIVSCIGDVYTSILYTRVKDYVFLDIANSAILEGKKLKDAGADIIIANIHGASSGSINDYAENNILANAVYNNKYLFDAILNGHTHQEQLGTIKRDGADINVIQSGCNCGYLGEIELYYDTVTKSLIYSYADVYTINSIVRDKEDPQVRSLIDQRYEDVKDQMEEVYCIAGESIRNRSDLYDWASNVMLASVGASVAISNNGGIRSTGNISYGSNITLENVYMINPFDNQIIVTYIKGKDLLRFLSNSSIYYSIADGITISNSDALYKVAVIDYVYYWDSFPNGENQLLTDLCFRDLMIMDLKLRDKFNPSSDSKAKIGNLLG